jgi:enoyl-CoA hydratase/carnithine racemase
MVGSRRSVRPGLFFVQTSRRRSGNPSAMFRLALDAGLARLTLDRPQARNAIPAAGWAELGERLGEVERSDAMVLILAGAGDAFCAGADLGDFPAMQGDPAACAQFRVAIRSALDRLREIPVPTIAHVDGACYGAGVALAIACDLRVAGQGALFAITPAKIGVGYPQEDVHRLVQLVGPGQAARLLFTAQSLDGAEAARIGLVELYAPEGGVDALAAAIGENARDSLVDLKRAIRLASEGRRGDAEQDRRFDALIGGAEVARRLEALRRK